MAAPIEGPPLDLLVESNIGVLVTLKRDGRPQLSNVSHTFDPDTGLIRISVTDGRAKTANIRRDERVSYYVTAPGMGRYLVAEGTAALSPPVADPGDAVVEELIEVYRAIQGEHPDWADYRRAMVADRRMVLTITVQRAYGMV